MKKCPHCNSGMLVSQSRCHKCSFDEASGEFFNPVQAERVLRIAPQDSIAEPTPLPEPPSAPIEVPPTPPTTAEPTIRELEAPASGPSCASVSAERGSGIECDLAGTSAVAVAPTTLPSKVADASIGTSSAAPRPTSGNGWAMFGYGLATMLVASIAGGLGGLLASLPLLAFGLPMLAGIVASIVGYGVIVFMIVGGAEVAVRERRGPYSAYVAGVFGLHLLGAALGGAPGPHSPLSYILAFAATSAGLFLGEKATAVYRAL